jgi:hypothetical protein
MATHALYRTMQKAGASTVARKVDEHLGRFENDIDNGFKSVSLIHGTLNRATYYWIQKYMKDSKEED